MVIKTLLGGVLLLFGINCTRAPDSARVFDRFMEVHQEDVFPDELLWIARPRGDEKSRYWLITTSARLGRAGGDWELWDAREQKKLGKYELPNLEMLDFVSEGGNVRVIAYWGGLSNADKVTRVEYEVGPRLVEKNRMEIHVKDPRFIQRGRGLYKSCRIPECRGSI